MPVYPTYRGLEVVRVLVVWPSFTMRDTVAENAHDVYCGRHSGIPDCCIVYFRDVWNYMPLGARRLHSMTEPPDVGYVRCPPCRDRVPIRVKRCRCSDHKGEDVLARRRA